MKAEGSRFTSVAAWRAGIRKYRSLSQRERWLFRRALATVFTMRVALWFLPLAILIRAVRKLGARPILDPGRRIPPPELARMVARAGRIVPFATCLTQALALQTLMAASGYATTIRIGVAKQAGAKLESHAWLEYQGEVLLGGPGTERYAPILEWSLPEVPGGPKPGLKAA